MSLATQWKWKSVSPTKDCNIPLRSALRKDKPGALDRTAYSRAVEAVRDRVGERAAAVVELCRELGLRSKEASLLDSRAALAQANARGSVRISKGTKGGLDREVRLTNKIQLEALKHAALAQGEDRSMIPSNQSWKIWRSGVLREAREQVREHTQGGLHDLRAAFACQQYEELTGHAAPAAGGVIIDKNKDLVARLAIAQELGHHRYQIASEYIGGRR